MSVKVIHINDSKKEISIIPTNEWLQPIKPFITSDLNSNSLIMLAKMISNGEVIVKISTNTDFNRIKLINKAIKNFPNMLYTFKTIECDENQINYDMLYTDCGGFCNRAEIDGENIKLTLEIMKLYDGSLTKYIQKLNIDKLKNVLEQLVYAQINIFDKIGFIHNDIHLGNILIKKLKSTEIETLTYNIMGKKYIVQTNRRLILSDFDKSIIYDPSIMELIEHNSIYTLQYNIVKTFKMCEKLLSESDAIILTTAIDKALNKFHYHYLTYSEKALRSFYKLNYTFNEYTENSVRECIHFSNYVFKTLYDVYLFPSYEL
jgi:thiamine kinase-like enzyme